FRDPSRLLLWPTRDLRLRPSWCPRCFSATSPASTTPRHPPRSLHLPPSGPAWPRDALPSGLSSLASVPCSPPHRPFVLPFQLPSLECGRRWPAPAESSVDDPASSPAWRYRASSWPETDQQPSTPDRTHSGQSMNRKKEPPRLTPRNTMLLRLP